MQKECYGKMFPDLLELRLNAENKGRVFGFIVKKFGLGVQERKMSVDKSAWEACKACPEYRTCYDLSFGQFMLESTLLSYA